MTTVPASGRGDDRVPGALRVAAALVGAEALALLGAAVFLCVELVVATATDAAAGAVTAAFAAAAAVVLALVSRGLLRRRRWSRTPAVLTQVLLLPVAVGVAQNAERRLVGAVLMAIAVVALGALLSPTVSRAVGATGERTDR